MLIYSDLSDKIVALSTLPPSSSTQYSVPVMNLPHFYVFPPTHNPQWFDTDF
jgi:hypothetical protein